MNISRRVIELTGLAAGSFLAGSLYSTHRRTTDPTLHAEPRIPSSPDDDDRFDALAMDNARRIFAFGNPGPLSDKLVRQNYVLAYDRRLRLPHFVAQVYPSKAIVSEDNAPDRKRCTFAEDGDIPKLFRARNSDYKGAPDWDRGHLAPAADMPTLSSQNESFLLSNIAPQHKTLNRGFWGDFESWIRNATLGYDEAVVFTGPLFLPRKDLESGKSYVRYEVLGNPPNTPVPNAFFKVILARRGANLYSAAFMVPNEPLPRDTALKAFEVPVDAVESATGLSFLPDGSRKGVKKLCEDRLCDLTGFARFGRGIR
jgi:endonuclease G